MRRWAPRNPTEDDGIWRALESGKEALANSILGGYRNGDFGFRPPAAAVVFTPTIYEEMEAHGFPRYLKEADGG